MDDLKRRDNESLLDFYKRITDNRQLYDLDYSEWAELILGEKKYSSDNARKAYYVIKPIFDNLIKENIKEITDIDVLEKVKEKECEVDRKLIEVQTEKLELFKGKRIDVRNEMLYKKFINSAKEIEVPDFKPIVIKNGKKEGHLGLSDFHFGKAFVCLNNSYDEQEFYNRMNKLASEVIEICKEEGITHLHVLNCGDDVEGMNLRVSQLKSLQLGFTDQVIKLARYMVKFLNKLSEELEVTYHHVLEGNHSELRCFNDKTWTLENMERIIIAYINDLTEDNPRITVPQYGGKFACYDVLEYTIYARHGHKKINENTIIDKASSQLRKWIDIAYFGHLHHGKRKTVSSAEGYNKQVIYIPSIMGEDEYSEDNYFGGACSGAILDIYQEGKCIRKTYDIVLN